MASSRGFKIFAWLLAIAIILLLVLLFIRLHSERRAPGPVSAQSAPAAEKAASSAAGGAYELVSWNVQTFGNVKPERLEAARRAYAAVISTMVCVMAVQEIANDKGLALFESGLPGGPTAWTASFSDTPDSQDNAIFVRKGCASIKADGLLFQEGPDINAARHPVRWARISSEGGSDFTLLSLHLSFEGGNTAAAEREMDAVLDWLAVYSKDPANRDVVIAGDFNLPSRQGKALSARGKSASWPAVEELIEKHGGQHLTVLVDEPTSRPKGVPQNNYDHFVVTDSMLARLASPRRAEIALVDGAETPGGRARVSDHYPVEALVSK